MLRRREKELQGEETVDVKVLWLKGTDLFEDLREDFCDWSRDWGQEARKVGMDWAEESLVSPNNDIFLYSKSSGKPKILKREVTYSNVSIFKRSIWCSCVG